MAERCTLCGYHGGQHSDECFAVRSRIAKLEAENAKLLEQLRMPDDLEELMENVRRIAPDTGTWLCVKHEGIATLVDRIREAELEAASAKRDLADALRKVAELEAVVELTRRP